jgi:malate dehydrogenase
MRDWALGADGLRSMAVPSGGQYGVEGGLICSFPVRCSGGDYEIVAGLEIGDFAQSKLDITVGELEEERDAVKGLGLIG